MSTVCEPPTQCDEINIKNLIKNACNWNSFRDKYPEWIPNLAKFDLSGYDLTEVNLDNAILAEADLSSTILKNTSFIKADLSGANLSYAQFYGTDFTEANIYAVNLNNTYTQKAKFDRVYYYKDYNNIHIYNNIVQNNITKRQKTKHKFNLKNTKQFIVSFFRKKEKVNEIDIDLILDFKIKFNSNLIHLLNEQFYSQHVLYFSKTSSLFVNDFISLYTKLIILSLEEYGIKLNIQDQILQIQDGCIDVKAVIKFMRVRLEDFGKSDVKGVQEFIFYIAKQTSLDLANFIRNLEDSENKTPQSSSDKINVTKILESIQKSKIKIKSEDELSDKATIDEKLKTMKNIKMITVDSKIKSIEGTLYTINQKHKLCIKI
jgi:hypothetical protein